MTRTVWFRLTTTLLVTFCVGLSSAETKEKGKAAKSAEKAVKAEDEVADKAEKAEKPVAKPEDVDAFRKRTDVAAVEIVTLHDEIDKAYTDLRTAMNVAQGDDKEARKARNEIKTLEARIKRQSRKLETAVAKLVQPIERDYKGAKAKYDVLEERAAQYEEEKREKNATATHQQAARYTAQLDAAQRTLDAVRSFLTFESAEGLDLGSDAADARSGRGGRGARTEMGGKERAGQAAADPAGVPGP